MLGPAGRQADALGHGWVGDEHALLALLDHPSPASETLEQLGVARDAVVRFVRASSGQQTPPSTTASGSSVLQFTPAFHESAGRAVAFAAMVGVPRPRPEHWLLALVWHDSGLAVGALHDTGVSQAAVLDELRRRGVRVPDVDPPEYRPWDRGQEIEVAEDDLQPLLDVLRRRHPPGSGPRWGFNWAPDEPRRALVDAEVGIDLEAARREVATPTSS